MHPPSFPRILVLAVLLLWSRSAAAQSPVPPTPTEMRVRLLYLPAEEARPASTSPIDTLHMSLLEGVFWGRHGLFRATGLFRTDAAHPTNDLRHLAQVRRRMLSLHQALGLASVASMTVTVVGGQRAIEGKGSGLHEASLPVTIGLYATTATLALAAPPKLIPARGGIDTITFHKVFAVAHLAGMVLTPMLAPDDEGGGSGRSLPPPCGPSRRARSGRVLPAVRATASRFSSSSHVSDILLADLAAVITDHCSRRCLS